jgi:AbrB family looped-hinge helix DNA binding protein
MAHRSTPDRYAVTVGARGRVVLPSPVRARLGVREGDRLVLTVSDDAVRLVPLRDAVASGRGIYAHLADGGSLVDELIADRRREAARE